MSTPRESRSEVCPAECRDFGDRLQHALDRRALVEHDEWIRRHAAVCSDCRQDLAAWMEVASILNASTGRVAHSTRDAEICDRELAIAGRARRRMVVGTAAVGLVAIGVMLGRPAGMRTAGEVEVESRRADEDSVEATLRFPGESAWNARDADLVKSQSPRRDPFSPAFDSDELSPTRWIKQTAPVVRRFHRHMAPWGRSLLLAASILTGNHPSQTS